MLSYDDKLYHGVSTFSLTLMMWFKQHNCILDNIRGRVLIGQETTPILVGMVNIYWTNCPQAKYSVTSWVKLTHSL